MAKSEEPPYPWNIRALMRTLEKLYLEDSTLKQYWSTEKAIVEARFQALQARLQKQYAEPEVIGIGGAGIVLKIADRQLGDRLCALKFPRPVGQSSCSLDKPHRQGNSQSRNVSAHGNHSNSRPRNPDSRDFTARIISILRDGLHFGPRLVSILSDNTGRRGYGRSASHSHAQGCDVHALERDGPS